MPLNVNINNLTEMHGSKAVEVFREIADLGGYGAVGNGEGQISPQYAGGLDVQGALDPANTAISSAAKDRIAELAGVDRRNSDNFQTTSSASKQKKAQE
jgi:hypothetical protein